MFGSAFVAFSCFLFNFTTKVFYSPQNTNSVSYFGQLIGLQVSMIAGAMFSLNAIGFSIMPGAIKSLSNFHKIMTKPTIYVAPPLIALFALEMLDRYNLFSVMPLCFSMGLLISVSY